MDPKPLLSRTAALSHHVANNDSRLQLWKKLKQMWQQNADHLLAGVRKKDGSVQSGATCIIKSWHLHDCCTAGFLFTLVREFWDGIVNKDVATGGITGTPVSLELSECTCMPSNPKSNCVPKDSPSSA